MRFIVRLCLTMLVVLLPALPALAGLNVVKVGTYATGQFSESAAEIVAYDAASKRLFVVNAQADVIDVLDLADGRTPKKIKSIDLKAFGKGVNSVACHQGLLAAAVEADPKQEPGKVVFLDTDGNVLGQVQAGALPDMVTFTPDGRFVLAANEGEPNSDYSKDPEGSVTVVDLSNGPEKATARTAAFTGFNDQKEALQAKGVRISGPKATVARDMEPEYIAVSADGKKAWASCQENNALAVIDVEKAEIVDILPLGLKDWAGSHWTLDASDKDKKINLQEWPVWGCYMPDAVSAYSVDGQTYIISANEGDSREYGDYADEIRVAKAKLDEKVFPNAKELQDNKALGRLKVIPDLSDTDKDGDLDRLVAFGARSFSIWDENGQLVWDSGDAFEKIMAEYSPRMFNTTNDENKFDDRSDDKGPEPEGVAIGRIDNKTLAFIALERAGGFMVYDVTDPKSPQFIDWVIGRDFHGDVKTGMAGDLGPEGLLFVPAQDSPTQVALLLVANEISGTTTVYEVTESE